MVPVIPVAMVPAAFTVGFIFGALWFRKVIKVQLIGRKEVKG